MDTCSKCGSELEQSEDDSGNYSTCFKCNLVDHFNSKILFKKDDLVVIKKGSVVKSMHPTKSNYTLNRKQTIKVNHCYDALNDDSGKIDMHVSWAGTGGYWCWTSVKNVVDGE